MYDFLLGDIICFIGTSLRYAADRVFNMRSGKAFKSYRNYTDSSETIFIDGILGAGIIFLALYIIPEVF
jgi:hypothetical protein